MAELPLTADSEIARLVDQFDPVGDRARPA